MEALRAFLLASIVVLIVGCVSEKFPIGRDKYVTKIVITPKPLVQVEKKSADLGKERAWK